MFHAGLIGNLGILEVLGTLTAGQFNKVLPRGKAGFTLKDISKIDGNGPRISFLRSETCFMNARQSR